MGNYILNNDLVILRCNNLTMDFLYKQFFSTAKSLELGENKAIMEFVSHLNQDVYGAGSIHVEIQDYLKKNDPNLVLFLRILEKVINKIAREQSQYHFELASLLSDFKKQLIAN